jgi:hypothetical protein
MGKCFYGKYTTSPLKVKNIPSEEKGYRGVSVKKELIDQIENFIQENPQYKGVADFVHEAIRVRMEDLKSKPPRFEHFNIGPDGARITDRQKGIIADIYFKPSGIFCDVDKSNTCEHIDFALTVPKIKEIIKQRKKDGWNLQSI